MLPPMHMLYAVTVHGLTHSYCGVDSSDGQRGTLYFSSLHSKQGIICRSKEEEWMELSHIQKKIWNKER